MSEATVFRRYAEATATLTRLRHGHRDATRAADRRLCLARQALTARLLELQAQAGGPVALRLGQRYVHLRHTQTQTTVSAAALAAAMGAVQPDVVRVCHAKLSAEGAPCGESRAWWTCLLRQLREAHVRRTACLVVRDTAGRRAVVDTAETQRLVQEFAAALEARDAQRQRVAIDTRTHALMAKSAADAVVDALRNGHRGEGRAVRPDGSVHRFRVEQRGVPRPVTPSVCSRFAHGLTDDELARLRRDAQSDATDAAGALLEAIKATAQKEELRVVTVCE
jgi:hypothetical protein